MGNNNYKKTICLFGTYAENNTGDDLMLASQIINIRKRCTECRLVIFTGERKYTQQLLLRENLMEGQVHIVYTGRWGLQEPGLSFLRSFYWIVENILEISGSNLLIIGPGNQIQDVTMRYRIVFFLLRAWLAGLLKTPYVFMGIGYYDLRSQISRWLFRVTANRAVFISTRDKGASIKISQLGVKQTKIVPLADVCFSCNWHSSEEKKSAPKPALIGLTYRIFLPEVFPIGVAKNLEVCLANLLQRIKEKIEPRFRFFPFYKGSRWNDTVAFEHLSSRFDENDFPVEIFHFNTLGELLKGIARCDALIGVRYHSVLMATQAGVPALGISYARKTQRFMAENGIGEYVLPVEGVTDEKLWDRWERLWREQDQIVKKLAEIKVCQRQLALKHFDLIFRALQ